VTGLSTSYPAIALNCDPSDGQQRHVITNRRRVNYSTQILRKVGQSSIQINIVHQIRNSLRYVAAKNHKAFMVDLKRVYRAASLGEAEAALDELEALWGDKYPIVIKSWRTKWDNLSAYFKYPNDIRRIIYTTNSIEAVHRQFRKLTKTKGGFPNDDSLLKLLYMGIINASKKWTMPIQNWNITVSQLSIFFEGRLDAVLDL